MRADATLPDYKGEPLDLARLRAPVATGSHEIKNLVWSVRVVDAEITFLAVASLY